VQILKLDLNSLRNLVVVVIHWFHILFLKTFVLFEFISTYTVMSPICAYSIPFYFLLIGSLLMWWSIFVNNPWTYCCYVIDVTVNTSSNICDGFVLVYSWSLLMSASFLHTLSSNFYSSSTLRAIESSLLISYSLLSIAPTKLFFNVREIDELNFSNSSFSSE